MVDRWTTMFLSMLLIITVTYVVVQGQSITPVYIQINTPVTLTCPADDQATILSWTGPGGTLYVTGTTAEADLSGIVKPRISASHTGGSYTLTFIQFQSLDIGIYKCTVDGTMDLQMVIVQGVTSASPVYTRLGGTVTLQCPDNGGSASWSLTSTGFIYTSGTQINPNLADSIKTRLAVTNQSGIYSLHISNVQLSDVREYKCTIGLSDTFYHLLLYIPPDFPEIENTISVDGQNRTIGTEDGSMTLTCNARDGTPASNVSWIKDDNILLTTDNAVQYRKVCTRADDRTVYTCQSSSPALTKPQTTSVLIYLDLKPGQPTISGQMSQTENTDIQVVCESTGSRPAADIEWNVGGTFQSSNPTEAKVMDSATETYTVTSTISLRVTRPDNGKSVYCRASNRALSGGTESLHRTITVLFGPDNVNIIGNRVVVANSMNTLTLTCTTEEYNRYVHITWYNGTSQIPNTAVVTNTSGSYGGLISIQVLQLTPDRYQDGNVIRCVVQNEDVTLGGKSASITLDIQYQPYLTLILIPGAALIEGRDLVIRCVVESNPVPSSVTWSRAGGQLPSDANVTSGVLRVPSTHRTDKGTYMCTAENSIGSQQDSLVIEIHYLPDIHINYANVTYMSSERILTCAPDGDPAMYQFGQWRHTAEDGTLIRHLTGSSNSTKSILTLPDHGTTRRYEDTGYYLCSASNDIPVSESYASGSVFFVVEAPPVIITNTTVVEEKIGNNVTLEVEFYSRPGVSPGTVTWTKRSDGSTPSGISLTYVAERSLRTPFHGVEVQVKGYVATLIIRNIMDVDYGNYTVTIENSFGTRNHTLALIKTDRPSPPLYLLQKDVTGSSITVQWIPGSNGGMTQSFVIGYKSDVSKIFTELNAIPDNLESVMSYKIDGLKENTVYSIRIHAQNDIGQSDQIFITVSTSSTEKCHEELHSTRTALISVSVLCSVVFVAAVVFSIVINRRSSAGCLQRRDNLQHHSGQEMKQVAVPERAMVKDRDQDSQPHYQDLNPCEIQPASTYERLSGDDIDVSIEQERNNYESLKDNSFKQEYEELTVVGSKYANT